LKGFFVPVELSVATRNSDIVQEDIRVWVTAYRGDFLI
jgi:hypothetical protein